MDILVGHLAHGIQLIILLSMPAILLAAGIGLIIGILQAVTQVQEQTITAAPKILFVFLFILVSGPFTMDLLENYLRESIQMASELTQSSKMVLPSKPRLAYGEANSSFDFFKTRRPSSTSSKIKGLFQQSPSVHSMSDSGSLSTQIRQVSPKAGAGEQIYLQRRKAGTLPPPPKGRS
jgi:flagellar biosynthesis protein FliQ